ncbi:ROK family transcriptional regulator [Bosea psychrotolerans]|uniref:Putative NBD/HSP70 family sugar kinase n=1 Tax=Bosea psychrotolerans TaxID=1871628 RepID=A0A2S4LX12_9HYPH|nr:ROK family transcriptional regulator [Bosea psychrotolerans]POR46996.1 putative NBD/HSP70 family sugar kinase [Bosea psychrotolerans]
MKGAWSRQETRAAVLRYLWRSGGSFRPDVIAHVGLTDASISRIVADLKAEGLVDESRKRAPYRGGPSTFLTLSESQFVATIELSNNRLHAGVGSLKGEVLFSAQHELPDGTAAMDAESTAAAAITGMADWCLHHDIVLRQVAVSVPGYHPGQASNPIMALRRDFITRALEAALPEVPTTFANSIVTRALAHRLQIGVTRDERPYFYVFLGHGVGGAFVDESAGRDDVLPCEIGHMIMDRQGVPCRCGHSGCLEANVSTGAMAPLFGKAEQQMLAPRDSWRADVQLSPHAGAEIDLRLAQLGTAIGNALNLNRVRRVVVAGWPGAVQDRAGPAVLAGIDRSLFGGAAGVDLSFSAIELGREPASGIALATFAFVNRGGHVTPAPGRKRTRRLTPEML